MSEQQKMERERAAFEAWYRQHHGHRDMYEIGADGEYTDKAVQGAFNVWQARASLPVGVPDALREAVEYLDDNRFNEIGSGSILHRAMRDALAAAPTVKAEQVQCEFCDDTGQIQGTDCGRCAPSLPAAGLAEEELWAVHAQGPDDLYPAFSRDDADTHAAALNSLPMPEGISVSAVVVPSPWPAVEHWKYLAEQERDHVAALSAPQSAHVSVPRELLRRVCREDGASNDMAMEELRALLNGGEA